MTVKDFIWLRGVKERLRHRLEATEGKKNPQAFTHFLTSPKSTADPGAGQTTPKAFCFAARFN